MAFLLSLHSFIRWIIVIVAVIALVKLGLGWLRKMDFKKMDRGLIAGFTGLMDLQWLLGLIFLVWSGTAGGAGFPRHRLEHMFTMTLAVVVAHLNARWKTAPDNIRFRNGFILILISLALVYLGVAGLPNGWTL